MVFRLNDAWSPERKTGNKARALMQMKAKGFPVPNGFVLDAEAFDLTIQENNLEDDLKDILRKLNKGNLPALSKTVSGMLSKIKLPRQITEAVEANADAATLYAVRSSGTMEDLGESSFAGQYDTALNVEKKDIPEKIMDCYRSMFSETVLSYLVDRGLPRDGYKMCVVVQEMAPAEKSGIAFTINPSTGKDREMLIEVSEGLGENIVSGKTVPEQYFYNWVERRIEGWNPSNQLISKDRLPEYAEIFAAIQQFFGYPCDIEFAIANDRLYILQARKITNIQYSSLKDIWTTADFKDGGVSATTCLPYMWSLYEYIWEHALRSFIVNSRILRDEALPPKLGEMYFGRCYWNLSAVKKSMERIIGYKEREFDSTYGIVGNYRGDGVTTGITPKTVFGMIRIAIEQKKLLDDRRRNSELYKRQLLAVYNEFKDRYDSGSITDIEKDFYSLTHAHYLRSETTYFWQIFINTIHQSLYKDRLLKYASESEYLTLLGSMDNISHLLPFYEMWELSRAIRQDKAKLSYWNEHTVRELLQALRGAKHTEPALQGLQDILDKYGYHSDKELDISYPCYYEDPTSLIGSIKDMLALDDSFSPKRDQEAGHKAYLDKLAQIRSKVSPRKYQKFQAQVEDMRRLLWWREEFRDVSTRFYYLLRVYTIEYAKKLVADGVLNEISDVWFLKVGQLWQFLQDENFGKEDLQAIIEKNKRYYNGYRNYISENEIGGSFSVVREENAEGSLTGLGAGNGSVTGYARVVEDFSQIDSLQKGDILVTRFTDTGWTPKFAILSGIVTENGGILCHAAIVSREYGIPAVVCCKGAMDKIRTGQRITINGTTGQVQILA